LIKACLILKKAQLAAPFFCPQDKFHVVEDEQFAMKACC